MTGTTDRAAALARLAELGAKPELGADPKEAAVVTTGDEVYAGGNVARVLVRDAHLTYREKGELLHAFAVPGDTVLLTKAQADRLDGLGVTSVDAPEEEPQDEDTGDAGLPEAEAWDGLSAVELVAYAEEHPEDHEAILAAELARPEAQRRKTVLDAVSED